MLPDIALRPATPADLPPLNAVIERAIMSWSLPERVKRLALPSYRYVAHDLAHLHIVVAEAPGQGIVGVAAWEEADPRDLPEKHCGLLLHGLYVSPEWQRKGVGSLLMDAAQTAVADKKLDGLLVKAQADAAPFFLARGMAALPVVNPERDYANRFWLARSG